MNPSGILFVFFSLFLVFGCAPTADKVLVLPVDAQFANVYYSGCRNNSEIEKLPNWPLDTLQQRILLSAFDRMEARLQKELGKYATTGGYVVVDREDLANIILTLDFLPLHLQPNVLTLPLELRIRDLRNHDKQVRAFAAVGNFNAEAGSGPEENFYHYYGVLLGEAERNFPAEPMVMLFYPHEENNN